MVSDVPIGAFLSAGLDSSSIVAAMARKQSVRTYTITFPAKYRVGESTIDDPGVPQRLARKLGCEHHEIMVEPDVVGLLPGLTWHMDEPTADPAIITAYRYAARLASRRPSSYPAWAATRSSPDIVSMLLTHGRENIGVCRPLFAPPWNTRCWLCRPCAERQ